MILKTIVKYLSVTLILFLLGFGLWFWGTLKYVYSTGERAGYIQKFSKRGWVFKTWEGELAMVNIPGALQEKFLFSVVDDAVAKKIQDVIGQKLVIRYEQHRYVPLPIFAETEYFVTEVLPVSEDPVPSPTQEPK
ncbi:MAG: hypothetical protein KCHDKBKB_02076 [Elusimicrobia bacterium]|nr:hypothetical protein [Elusimicrobiota bacterium]